MVLTTITEPQPGDSTLQLAKQGEMATEGTAAIENQHRAGVRVGVGVEIGVQRQGGRRRMNVHRGATMHEFRQSWRNPFGSWGAAEARRAEGSSPSKTTVAPGTDTLGWVLSRILGSFLSLALVLIGLGSAPPPGMADGPGPAASMPPPLATPARYRCGGDLLLARSETGAVDAVGIPNTSAGTPPGAFVVLEWRGTRLQLPRTNNAGAPSYTDGRWWWSLEDPDQPRFRLRRGAIEDFPCTREP
jgi:hypothetical protein